MNLNNKSLSVILQMVVCCANLNVQQLSSDRGINFPDLKGHLILVSDFHSHTVFSDVDVWPTVTMEVQKVKR